MTELGRCQATRDVVTERRTRVHLKAEAMAQLQLTGAKTSVHGPAQTRNCFLKQIWGCPTTAMEVTLLGDELDDF